MTTPLLSVSRLSKSFSAARGAFSNTHGRFLAVDAVSFDLFPGETLGLVGESGCGKSTTGRLILRLIEADSGSIAFAGTELTGLSQRQLLPLRRQMQMVFQDPFSSLNPRMSIGEAVTEPLLIHGLATPQKARGIAAELLSTVGLGSDAFHRFPHEFSGGQRQRVGIARALAVRPQLIIADEPVSALDLSIQAQVLNLLQTIQKEFGLTYLFISHDLSVVEQICDRVAVMYLGQIVESAPAAALYSQPLHPYTEALLQAVPRPDPSLQRRHRPLRGEIPSPLAPPDGCRFHPRCPYAEQICRSEAPLLRDITADRKSACHFAGTLSLSRI